MDVIKPFAIKPSSPFAAWCHSPVACCWSLNMATEDAELDYVRLPTGGGLEEIVIGDNATWCWWGNAWWKATPVMEKEPPKEPSKETPSKETPKEPSKETPKEKKMKRYTWAIAAPEPWMEDCEGQQHEIEALRISALIANMETNLKDLKVAVTNVKKLDAQKRKRTHAQANADT